MLLSLPFLLPALFALEGVEPGRPIAPEVPWAIAPDDGPRSYLERLAGRPIDPRSIPPIRQGNLVYDAESMAIDMLKALDIPVYGVDHEPTPGVLYVAMDGITLSSSCNSQQSANAARNCSPLVSGSVDFPALAGGNGQVKAAEYQKLSGYYADFNLVLTSGRPPDWLPYTMAVIGGTSGNAGLGQGICGVANVACDGAKRNHVSLTFSDSCSGDVAEIAAQETAHNWGLEHTDIQSDLMYPFTAGGASFRDECMAISHATGDGITQCGYIHKAYCPEGAGEQQNSHGELIGVFGPRVADTEAPVIVSVTPADGTTISSADTITVSATISDNSNFIGVNWTWVEGLPDSLKEDGYRRCTNDVCDDNYTAWIPIDTPWDFLQLKQPPPGAYKFKVETMDAYGNYASKVVGLTVLEEEGPGETGGTDETGETGGGGGDSDTPTGGFEDSGDVPTEGGGGGSDPTTITGASDESSGGDGGGGDGGGGCRLVDAPAPAGLLLLLGLGLRRRRRA